MYIGLRLKIGERIFKVYGIRDTRNINPSTCSTRHATSTE